MKQLVCNNCNSSYSLQEVRWRCNCGSILDIQFDFKMEIETIRNRSSSMWRYREAIPVERDKHIVSFGEGFTPLVPIENNGNPVYAKLEYLSPSGSFKDRGASALISKVKELGIEKVVIDSSGNAGCAVSTYCAKAGIACEVYVPEQASPAKLKQIRAVGANVCTIPGPRDEAAIAVLKAAETEYYAGHTWNPFFYQGTKTFAFEVWEQLGFKEPDTLFFPTGSGSLLIGTYLGFVDLMKLNLIEKMPRLIAVQSENCAPLHKMFHEDLLELPKIQPQKTVAEGIAVASPARGRQIMEIIQKTKGTVIAASEDEIVRHTKGLCKRGFFIEPTSAAGFAALEKYDRTEDEVIVIPLTGHGLKSSLD